MQEDKQTEQYEEFDYLSDFYFPIKDEEQKYGDPIISEMRANGIDPYEALGETKVEGLEAVKRVEDKDIEKEKISYSEAILDFLKDLPENAILSTAEALANLSNNAVQVGGFISNKMFRDTKLDGISDFTTDVAINYNKGAENYVKSIEQYVKDNDINGISKFVTDIGLDIGASVPYRKMLKKAGLPNYIATPLSFGLAYGTTGAEKEQETNMFIDSQSINRLNEMMGVIDGTPESEVAELVATTFEGTAWAGITDRLIPIFKSLKKNLPIYMNQQTAVSAGGAAATTETVNQINESLNQDLNVDQPEQPEQNLEEEKKTLNQSNTLEDADNMYASAGLGPVFFSMVREAAKKIPNKGSATQMLNTLKNTKGVKQSELKWTGLDDFLKDKKTVTKQEIQEYLSKNTLDVSEIKLPRTSAEAELFKNLRQDIDKVYSKLYKELSDLPENQGRMVGPFNYKLTNVLEDGTRTIEDVSLFTLESNFIGNRLSSYIPIAQNMTKEFSKGKFYDKAKLIDDYGKEGDPNTLQFYMFEDNVSGQLTAVPKKRMNELINKKNEISGGKYEFSYVTEMDIKEAEKFLITRVRDKIDDGIKDNSATAKFGDGSGYVEQGGKDYKELIFKLKDRDSYPLETETLGEFVEGTKKVKTKTSLPYRSPEVHFGTKNEFAHVRFKTRDLNGQKVLTVEEMQSDIVQDMKKAYSGQVTDFPFKNNWYELVTKRLIRYASDNGFDAVAIPKANPIMSRYKQSAMAIDNLNIKVIRHPRGSMFLDEKDGYTTLFPKDAEKPALYRFVVNYKEGDKLRKSLVLDEKEIFETLDGYKVSEGIKNQVKDVLANKGKFVADELTIDAPITKMIVGSGKGKVQLYNQAIPSFMKKYGKKWNAKVYDDSIELEGTRAFGADDKYIGQKKMPVTIIQLTDDMKQSVQQDGQALFSIFGLGLGSKIASDSIENNIISEQTK